MKALLLTDCPDSLSRALAETNTDYAVTNGDPATIRRMESYDQFDWLISFGYRYILPPDLVDEYEGRAINIHISLLPWNRGADPNFWSWFDNTLKGVSIHQITRGTDTGPVLIQRPLRYLWAEGHTLRSSYGVLMREAAALFAYNWIDILNGQLPAIPQSKSGTYHRKADKLPYMKSLPGWDATCEEVERLGVMHRARLAA